jgi:hypothetical protein
VIAPAPEPLLGIYWLVGTEVVAFSQPMNEVPSAAGFRDANVGHADLWPRVVARHPELRGLDYFVVPRGRVLYVEDGEIFRLFMPSREAKKKRLIERVIATFALPVAQVQVCQDRHYEPPGPDLFKTARRRG